MSNQYLRQQAEQSQRFLSARLYRQAGMSSIGLVTSIALGLLLLTCTLKMLPAYIQNWNVQSVLDSVLTEHLERATPLTKAEIRSRINKRLNINQITVLTSKQIDIEKTAEAYTVIADYEVRESLFSNIDVVMKFDNSVSLPFSRQK
jgi:hypothetical protein